MYLPILLTLLTATHVLADGYYPGFFPINNTGSGCAPRTILLAAPFPNDYNSTDVVFQLPELTPIVDAPPLECTIYTKVVLPYSKTPQRLYMNMDGSWVDAYLEYDKYTQVNFEATWDWPGTEVANKKGHASMVMRATNGIYGRFRRAYSSLLTGELEGPYQNDATLRLNFTLDAWRVGPEVAPPAFNNTGVDRRWKLGISFRLID